MKHLNGSHRRAMTVGVVACTLVGAAACSSSEDDADAKPTDSGVTAGDGAVPSDPTTSLETSSSQVERATAFWEALAAGERDTASSLVDPPLLASGAGSPFGRAHTLEGQFDWYEAVGWQWSFGECVMGDGGVVECTATASNAWSDALGAEPVTGTFLLRVSDNGIGAIDDRYFSSQWLQKAFGPFASWVRANHPEDAAVMFDFDEDVNPQILDLYATNTERFVEAQQVG